jgi:enoyl-[acyl-carrier-protein] reductase (NADH)
MIAKDKTYIVMGLLDPESIAYVIGRTIAAAGGKVVFTVQNERLQRLFLDRSHELSDAEKERLVIRYCDVTADQEIRALFAEFTEVAGVVHSVAYANPRTCLGEEFHTDAYDDLKLAYHVSAVSLAAVVRHAQPAMPGGGAVVTLSFDSRQSYPYYNWMGVNKAALEAVVRALARRHGRDLLRINAVSAGPLRTKAANAIPGFGELSATWEMRSPLPWDNHRDKQAVADAVLFLLSEYAAKITGQILYVDGGASAVGGPLLPFERPANDADAQ